MEHFVAPYDRARSDAFVDRVLSLWDERGWGLWALERTDTGTLIGFTGLSPAQFDAPFTPAVEVGWRLAQAHWGFGFATEAAREALRFGSADPDGDFEHPSVPEGHPLRPHVLYRLPRERWQAGG